MRVAFVELLPEDPKNRVTHLSLYLASFIKQYGHISTIVDIYINLHLPQNFFILAAKKILKDNPDVVGFSVMCNSLPASLLIAQEIKKIKPDLPIFFGGQAVSFEEVEILENFKQIDVIIRGEGELSLIELLKALESGDSFTSISGITFRGGKRIIRNPNRSLIRDLDSLPGLDYSLLPDLLRYERVSIEAGRGCPFSCIFCSTCRMWKRKFRIKSPQRLVKELKQIQKIFRKHKKILIYMIHDNFLYSRRFAHKFLALIRGWKIPWRCSTRLEVMDDKLIRLLRNSGCQSLNMGIETGSAEEQKEIKKNLPLDQLAPKLEKIANNGILVTTSFLIGFPNETPVQRNETLSLALKIKLRVPYLRVAVSLYTFFKGSELFGDFSPYFRNGDIEFCESNISPLLTNLAAERTFIKKHPYIFPSFFRLESKAISAQLRKEVIIFDVIIDFFPITVALLLGNQSVTLHKLGKKIIQFVDSRRIAWEVPRQGSDYRKYHQLFKKYVVAKATGRIKQVCQHEDLLNEIGSVKDLLPNALKKIKLSSQPRITEGVLIRKYDYDIPGIIEMLKKEENNEVNRSQCFIAYIPGKEIISTVPLGRLENSLLKLCDGKKSINSIIDYCLDEEGRAQNAKKVLFDKFKWLQSQGIISS